MKKLNLIMAVVLSTALFASCAKDNNVKGPDDEPGVPTLMSITLKTANSNTRANHYGDLTPTGPEKIVNNATIFILDKNDFLEETVTFSAGEMTKTFTVTTGKKRFLAAVNMNGKLPALDKGTTHLSKIKEKVITVAGISDAVVIDDTDPYTGSNFWMTTLDDNNTAELIEITKPADVANTANDVEIKVGRAVAKVGVYYKPDIEPADGALDATTVKYKIHNNPKGTMLFPSVDADGNRVTAFYKVAYSDQNYFHNSPYLATTATFDSGAAKVLHDAPSYMMENSNVVNKKSHLTFAMIQGKYVPNELLDENGDPGTPGGSWDGTFWRICEKGTKNYNDEYYYEDPDDTTVYDPSTHEAVEYEQGLAYYGLWMMNDEENGTVNRYAVKRNQYWSVQITSVSGCGEPDEQGVTEPDENVDAETYMTATIKVQDWEPVSNAGGI